MKLYGGRRCRVKGRQHFFYGRSPCPRGARDSSTRMRRWTGRWRCSGARVTEGATLPELTRAMGINRPSLYAAFGNKEQLFRKVLDHYQTGPQSFLAEALSKPTARAVVEAMFSGFIKMQRDRDKYVGALSCPGHLRAARRRSRSAGNRPD